MSRLDLSPKALLDMATDARRTAYEVRDNTARACIETMAQVLEAVAARDTGSSIDIGAVSEALYALHVPTDPQVIHGALTNAETAALIDWVQSVERRLAALGAP